MGTKRTYAQMERTASASSEKGLSSQTRRQPRYMEKQIHRSKEIDGRESTTGRARKRARTIERRLQHPKPLPANVRNDLERELASLRSTIGDSDAKKQRSKMISKYHMVRFFERRKATRLLRQLRQELASASSPEDVARLQKDVHIAQVDVAYTTYFPHLEPYVSLYPASKPKAARAGSDRSEPVGTSTTAKEALHLQRHQTWSEIEDAMAQGQAALERLRDRHENVGPGPIQTKIKSYRGSHIPENKSKKKEAEREHQDRIENSIAHDEDSDDGGFFE